jgi:hypothetical protein
VPQVAVRILHAEPGRAAGPLERLLADTRAVLAERHRGAFQAAGADDVAVVADPPDDTPFGARLRRLGAEAGGRGLVVLGSGAIPLARAADIRPFVAIAASGDLRALVNNRYSADIVAVGRAEVMRDLPDLPADNALPRWLDEVAGIAVEDLRSRWRLAIDLDSPLDVLLVSPGVVGPFELVRDRLRRVAEVMVDRHGELLVAGRSSADALRWLERRTACRVRAVIEERGLRAGSRLATSGEAALTRPPASALGLLLDRDGPGALGSIVARLADGAVVDTRVLLAHRLGPDERTWPPTEDRFASDLLLAERIADPWLRALTASAAAAPVPIVLGGHTLVGPGIRLVARWT